MSSEVEPEHCSFSQQRRPLSLERCPAEAITKAASSSAKSKTALLMTSYAGYLVVVLYLLI